MLLEATSVADVTERVVAIVKYGPPTDADGLRPGEFYQVTIDPERFSPCGAFIRFGTYRGDELIGWQNANMLYVVSYIAPWTDEDGENGPMLPWGVSPALEKLP